MTSEWSRPPGTMSNARRRWQVYRVGGWPPQIMGDGETVSARKAMEGIEEDYRGQRKAILKQVAVDHQFVPPIRRGHVVRGVRFIMVCVG
jgi:hypothetical protein